MKEKLTIRLDETFSGHLQKKWLCPACNKRRFVRFYNFDTSEYLPEEFGRCDREENCGYYQSPYANEDFKPGKSQRPDFIPVQLQKINYVQKDVVAKTLSYYNTNNFVQFLIDRIGEERAFELVYKFYIGTAKNNGTIFWQVDQFMNTRTGQKIHYNIDGHRNKDISPKRLFTVDDNYKPCLFGEHQLFTESANCLIAIVESEKTAVLANAYMPTLQNRRLIWMACSGSNGLTIERIQPLRGRDILLVPDFSFHARATWGMVPMRKKRVEKLIRGEMKAVLVPDADGELVADYESAKDRLKSIGCNVMFFDPYPELNDGTDIADTFVTETAPEHIDRPDFSTLEIKQSDLSRFKTLSPPDGINTRKRPEYFSLQKNSAGIFDFRTNFADDENNLKELFKNPAVGELFERLGIDDGYISKI